MNYEQLAGRVGDMVRMNNITEVDEYLFENVFTGDLHNQPEEGEDEDNIDMKEFYQYYAITESGARYLKEVTDEVVFYSDKLDAYFWGITHWGTPWDGVEVGTLKNNQD